MSIRVWAGMWMVLVCAVGWTRASEPNVIERPTSNAAGPSVGAKVVNFSLLDYGGKHYELRRTPAKALVLFFTGSDCPIARQTGSKLQAVADEFAPKGVAVWLVNATPQNDPSPARLDAMYE